MAQIDTNRFPYNQIEDRTVDGNAMVYIPKVYVKNATENGLIKRYISNVKKTGYHCHPAFMQSGHEVEGILIGKYLAKGTTAAPTSVETGEILTADLATAQTAGKVLGSDWHMYNIYEHHLLALLMLIEYGSTDLQNLIGGSSTANGVTHYGITDIWGSMTKRVWIDGIDTQGSSNTTLRVADNLGNGTMVDTGLVCGTDLNEGWIVDLHDESGEGYDLNDLFIGKNISSAESGGTFGDCQYLSTGGQGVYLVSGASSFCGAFLLYYCAPTASCAFRLAKYVA